MIVCNEEDKNMRLTRFLLITCGCICILFVPTYQITQIVWAGVIGYGAMIVVSICILLGVIRSTRQIKKNVDKSSNPMDDLHEP